MIESVVTVLKERPCGTKLLVAGDLNVNLLDPEEYFGGGGGGSGSAEYSRDRGHVGTLPPAPDPMVPGREDVEHGLGGEGGEVPD